MGMRIGDEAKVYSEKAGSSHRGLLRQFVEWLDAHNRSPEELLDLCLERIAARDEQLRAWVQVAPQPALGSGPLNGIPFGAKDIYETRGLATEYGSPLCAGRKGSTDASLVTELRKLGAVLVGKTQTTAFAYFDPAPTRNPHQPDHTPGGSSSGSAVAVAAGMVPFALGTQTLGSALRPASFCGVVGFKPSVGLLPLEGVLPFAPSLDTAGLFTQSADDMQLLWARMGHAAGTARRSLSIPTLMPPVEPAMEVAFRRAVERLDPNFSFNVVEMPPRFAELVPAAKRISTYEGARTHESRWREHGDAIGRMLAQLVEGGLRIPTDEYRAALTTVGEIKREMSSLFRQYPVLVTPSAPGPAPAGLESTGDPIMNSPWTALGVPAISIPMPVLGLPLGLQLVSESGTDAALLALAVEIEALLQ
ncbi:MAG: amidase [Acidobacteria bacterium]|nr:MAG: amidase [Acidobacteriota bacterium]